MIRKNRGVTLTALLVCCPFQACQPQVAGDPKERRASNVKAHASLKPSRAEGTRGPRPPSEAKGDEILHRFPQQDQRLAWESLKRWTVMKKRYVERTDSLLSTARAHLQDRGKVMAVVGKLEVLTFHCVHLPARTGLHATPGRLVKGWTALWERRRHHTAMENLIHGLLDRETCDNAWQFYLSETLHEALKEKYITDAQVASLRSGLARLRNLKRRRTLEKVLGADVR